MNEDERTAGTLDTTPETPDGVIIGGFVEEPAAPEPGTDDEAGASAQPPELDWDALRGREDFKAELRRAARTLTRDEVRNLTAAMRGDDQARRALEQSREGKRAWREHVAIVTETQQQTAEHWRIAFGEYQRLSGIEGTVAFDEAVRATPGLYDWYYNEAPKWFGDGARSSTGTVNTRQPQQSGDALDDAYADIEEDADYARLSVTQRAAIDAAAEQHPNDPRAAARAVRLTYARQVAATGADGTPRARQADAAAALARDLPPTTGGGRPAQSRTYEQVRDAVREMRSAGRAIPQGLRDEYETLARGAGLR